MLTTHQAAELDRAHPLLTAAFKLPSDVVYLDGNSLGALPVHVADRISHAVTEEWGTGLIRSWNDADWVGLSRRVGDRLASVIGAPPGTVTVCDSTSVNLFKATSAAMALSTGPNVLLTDTANFPSDRYVLTSLAEQHGWRLDVVDPSEVSASLTGGVGVLSATQVDYRTGVRADMAGLNSVASDHDVLTVWDLAHSAGAFRVAISESGADFAVGCGYKYLNGGPGAPAFLYAAKRHHEAMMNPITGWFSHQSPFDFSPDFEPADGIDRMRAGTSHVLSLVGLDAALDVFDQVDVDRLWSRGSQLTGHLIDGFDELGLEVLTPREPAARGSHAAFRHPQAYGIVQALIDRGVIGDFRTPDIGRFGVAPLYLTFANIANALASLADVLGSVDLSRYMSRRGMVV